MTRNELIEAMARAAIDFDMAIMEGISRDNFAAEFFDDYKQTAGAIFAAIEALGYVVVRKDAGDDDIKAALCSNPRSPDGSR